MGNGISSPSNTCVYLSSSCGADPHDHPVLRQGEEKRLPRALIFSLKFLTYDQVALCKRLCEMGQGHLFEGWEKISPDDRRAFCQQLQKIDKLLPHGEVDPMDSFDSIVEYDGVSPPTLKRSAI